LIFKSEIVFVKIILPLILGIIIGYYFQSAQLLDIFTAILTVLLALAIFINIFYKNLKAWKHKKSIASLYYLIIFAVGFFITLFHTDFLRPDYFAKKQYQQLKVWINNEPQQTNDILRFEATVTNGYTNQKAENCSGKLLVALKLDSLSPIGLNYGDELLISANYLPVEPPYNPAEFDFKNWLASKHIYHQTFIRQEQLVKLGNNKGNTIIKYALAVRQKQVDIYRKLIKDDEAFAVASTLILGYRADLSKETLAAYSKTGTIHALSVSGMHVGIIYIMLNWLLAFLDRKSIGRLFKTLLICGLVWYYSLITGFSPSVLRSAIMLTVYILAKQSRRSTNNYNVVSFAAILLLLIDPFVIWDVGFQLSFLAVFGLIYYQPKIYKWWYVENKWLDKLWSAVAMSLAAQLATLPLSVYYFHQFPVYFIISNLFILIPITVLMYAGIAILLLKVYFLAPAFEWLITFTNNGLKWIASLPYAGITEIWLNQWQLLLMCILIAALTIGLSYYKKKYILIGVATLLILQVSLGYQKINAVKQNELVFFSLRKNYAAAFINGNSAILVSDLTNDDKNFEFFVKPSLDQKQVNNIHFVKWEDDFTSLNFVKQQRQIIYNNKRILLLDSSFNRKKITQKPSFDFVWLHQNPKQKLENLKDEINFSKLVVDASNKDYIISKFEQHANLLNLPTYVLKKQKAVTFNLN